MKPKGPVLVGNAFPWGLVRRPVSVDPVDPRAFRRELRQRAVVSFWGHDSTLRAAGDFAGLDLAPETGRPALRPDRRGFPSLKGASFIECFVLSPRYRSGYRPSIGVEASPRQIRGWQALRVRWIASGDGNGKRGGS